MLTITSDNFENEVVRADKPVLVDFWAPWCGPCRAVAPVLDEVEAEVSGAIIAKVNVDEQPALAEKFGVMSIPTMILLKEGNVVGELVGLQQKSAILKLINSGTAVK